MWLLRERLLVMLEWNILHRIDSLMYTQKIANIFDHINSASPVSRLGLENKFLENKSGRILLRSTGLLYKFLSTNLGVCKLTFYNFYTSQWTSTIYHTDLAQNAVFHNFSRQIALSQYSGRSIVGFKRNRSKNFQNHRYGQPVLISIVRAVSVVECLNEL